MASHAEYLARYFRRLRAAGDDIHFLYGAARGDQVEWHTFSHDTHDGFGALHDMFGTVRPTRAALTPPPLRRRLGVLRRALAGPPDLPLTIPRADWSRPSRQPTRLAAHAFTVEETQRITPRGASAFGPLCAALQRAVAPRLAAVTPIVRWRTSVGMFGVDPRVTDPRANQFSHVDLDLPWTPTAADADGALADARARDEHWGNWWLQAVGHPIFGDRLLDKLLTANVAPGAPLPHALGTFTWLGACKQPGVDWIAGCPPAFRITPVGAGTMIANGRLSLAMVLHPAIGDDAEAEACLDAWRRELEATAPAPTAR